MAINNLKHCYNTSDDDISNDFYYPLLSWAKKYDRGVGYFTSEWIRINLEGMINFISNGGFARWIISPHISERDWEMFKKIKEYRNRVKFLDDIVLNNVDEILGNLQNNHREFFAWMIFDGIIDVKFAVPQKGLDGDFHDKFGVFYRNNEVVSFNGSQNDSAKGYKNYESIKVFSTWAGLSDFVQDDINRFEKLWKGNDDNLKTYKISEAIKNKIINVRSDTRPYKRDSNHKWRHQDEAVNKFIEIKNGILEMATGTGKTRTALKIICKLIENKEIESVIISTYGKDLLNQWVKEILSNSYLDDMTICKKYDCHNSIAQYLRNPRKKVLIVSRTSDNLKAVLHRISDKDKTLLIFDEVHGMGSEGLRRELSGQIAQFKYKLGLSATPEREYDKEGTEFIESEIGYPIYKFETPDAIKRGILCEMNYIRLPYVLTNSENKQISSIIGKYRKKISEGKKIKNEDMWREISDVRKLAVNKLEEFDLFIKNNIDLLDYTIIFVKTAEYGLKVQETLIKYINSYHVYYSETDKSKLDLFANGNIKVLITCQKLNEGVDIKTCKNIILFSSDRSRLTTIQRIGRCLRVTDALPDKVANVIDFVDSTCETDLERSEWIDKLSKIRRNI